MEATVDRQFSTMAALFATLALLYLVLVFAASPTMSNTVMTLVGAVFGGSLAFVLVRLFQIAEERRWEL